MVLAPLVAQQVRGRCGYLALVGAVAALLLCRACHQLLFLHDVADGPLANVHDGGDPTITVGPAAGLESLDHGLPGGGMLLGLAFCLGVHRVFVAALGHAHDGQELAELILGPQRRHHRRLLRVGQQVRVGARVFFYYLEGRLAHVQLQLRPPELQLRLAQHVLQDLDVVR